MKPAPLALALALTLAPAAATAQATLAVASPDGRTRLDIDTASGLGYRVVRDGRTILATSPIGMVTSQGSFGMADSTVTGTAASTADGVYRPVVGKASAVPDRYNQLVVHLTRPKDGVTYDLIARAYDDGIAFRFTVPAQPRFRSIDVYWETTGFYFPPTTPAGARTAAASRILTKPSSIPSARPRSAPSRCSTRRCCAAPVAAPASSRSSSRTSRTIPAPIMPGAVTADWASTSR